MDTQELKNRYLSLAGTDRSRLINTLWVAFGVENMKCYTKYYRRLSNLSIRADFCLAIDRFFDEGGNFETVFSREMRIDLESFQPIKQHLKKIMGRSLLKKNFPMDPNVSWTRLIFEVDCVNTSTKAPKDGVASGACCSIDPQIYEVMKGELVDFLVSAYGDAVYEDWLSHVVYGESLRKIGSQRGVSYETIRARVSKARLGLKEFLKEV